MISFAATSDVAADGPDWRSGSEMSGSVEERTSVRASRFIRIPDATTPRWEAGRPDYHVIGRSLGLSEELASLLDNYSASDNGGAREKPQKALARHFLNKVLEQAPFLSILREHVPKGLKFNIDLDDDGVAIEIKGPLPALVW